MKIILNIILILVSQIVFSQAPKSFKYQAVARDGGGELLVNKMISIKTSILAGLPTGSAVYVETQTLATNDYGVVTLNIGEGTLVSGSFSGISWGTNTYYVKTELDVNGGSSYQFMGTSQIMSVPYALYAEKTGTADTDHDTSKTNELQTLSVVGKTLSISKGNTVNLPPDNDNDTLNELQSISLIGKTLSISKGNSITLSGAVDLDADPTNELQILAIGHDTIYLSKGNFVVLPKDNDRDSTNEIQSLTLNQGTLKISKSNTVHLPDSSITNELQNIYIKHDTIYLSKSNFALLPNSGISAGLFYLGNGLDGDFKTNGNYTLTNNILECRNFKVLKGDTFFISETALIRVQDSCIIEGIIYGKGMAVTKSEIGSTGGGGSGVFSYTNMGGQVHGRAGINSEYNINVGMNILNSKIYTIYGGKDGATRYNDSTWAKAGNGNPLDTIYLKKYFTYPQLPTIHGTVGGNGGYLSQGNLNYGGNGGAGIYLVCNYLKFTGEIDLQGNNGFDAIGQWGDAASSGAGGGGGGSIIVYTKKIIQNSGTVSLLGGFGGNGKKYSTGIGFKGGNGADGVFKIITP